MDCKCNDRKCDDCNTRLELAHENQQAAEAFDVDLHHRMLEAAYENQQAEEAYELSTQ